MPSPEQQAAQSAIRAAIAAWINAYNTKDAATFFELYDPEIVYANEHAPLRRGVDAVRESFAGAFEAPATRIGFSEEALFASNDLGLITGTYHFSIAGEDGSLQPQHSGRVALLYRRAADGRWLLVFDIDNSPPDAADYRP